MRFKLAFFSFSFLLASCAGGRVYQADSVRPIRKVAVVAVDVVQPEEFNLADAILKPKQKMGDGPMSHMNFASATPSEQVNDYVEDLRTSLGILLRWNVLPTEKVEGNSTYQKFLKDMTEGAQMTEAIPEGKIKLRAPHLMDVFAGKRLTRAAREEIMEALHVDALAMAQYDVLMKGNTVMGIGSRYPQANLNFVVYRKGQDGPVWQDYVIGEEMKESVGKNGIALDFKKIKELSRASAKRAYAELQKTLKGN